MRDYSIYELRQMNEAYGRIIESFSATKESFGLGHSKSFIPDDEWAKSLYDMLNMTYFKGILPVIPINCLNYTTDRRTYGMAYYDINSSGRMFGFKITLNTLYHCTESEWAETLIHEMIHILDYCTHPEHYRDDNYKAHGAWFQSEGAKVNAVGWHVGTYGNAGTNDFVMDRQKKRDEKTEKAREEAEKRKAKLNTEYEKRTALFNRLMQSGNPSFISILFGKDVKQPTYGLCSKRGISKMDEIWRKHLFENHIHNAVIHYYMIRDPWWATSSEVDSDNLHYAYSTPDNSSLDDIKSRITEERRFDKKIGREYRVWTLGKFQIDFDYTSSHVLEWTDAEYGENAVAMADEIYASKDRIYEAILTKKLTKYFNRYYADRPLSIGKNKTIVNIHTEAYRDIPSNSVSTSFKFSPYSNGYIDMNIKYGMDYFDQSNREDEIKIQLVLKRHDHDTHHFMLSQEESAFILECIDKGVVPSYVKKETYIDEYSPEGRHMSGMLYNGHYFLKEEYIEADVDLSYLREPMRKLLENSMKIANAVYGQIKPEFMKFCGIDTLGESIEAVYEDADEDDYDTHEHIMDAYARKLYDKHTRDGDIFSIKKIDDDTIEVGIY